MKKSKYNKSVDPYINILRRIVVFSLPITVCMVLSFAFEVFLSSPASAEIILQPGFDQSFIEDVGGRTRAWGVGVADFNNDDIDDIVSGDTFGDIHLYTGVSNGIFVDKGIKINMGFHDAYALATGDFNDDGYQDFILSRTGGSSTPAYDGEIHLYLGNGDGSFQSTGFPQAGIVIGDAGTDAMSLAAADVDNDGDMDFVSGDIVNSDNGRADITLFRNQLVESGILSWTPEVVVSAESLSSPDPEQPPYFPPTSYLHAYGLAFGDMDGDDDQDLLVGDRASYLYVYENDGIGNFEPVRYDKISTRPYAYARLHETFTSHLSLATGDLNGDGLIDIVSGGTDSTWEGQVDLWLNEGLDGSGRVTFLGAGIIGGAGTDARGLAVGQLNSSIDLYLDVVFGNFEGELYGLFTDRTDSDGDGIVDRFDNAPLFANAPRLDMNTDGGINYLDQLDNDFDGIGDPADDDDDDDSYIDQDDNCMFTENPDQVDTDNDGFGDVCDPLNNSDTDGDGVPDGPVYEDLWEKAFQAKARWSESDTHFIIRIDALGRVFQNEFTQTFTDAGILSSDEWDLKKGDSYNGIGDSPAIPGYTVPSDLPGGMEVPITLMIIPKLIWNAFGDDDPIRWINDRISNSNLEIGLHGTYHNDNTPLGDWKDLPDRNFFSCETCGFTLEEMYQLLRVGQSTLLGEYEADLWIQDSGATEDSPRIIWDLAANPLISYAPPFNASDTVSRDAVSQLGFAAFSASIYEENSEIFTPEGSNHEMFDQFGMYHASADLQVRSEVTAQAGMTYLEYLDSITQFGGLNTWLIEEVEWSSRYCNDKERLEPCPDAPGGINRENNMIDEQRWENWLTLLDYAKKNGQVMTMGDYALAMAFDNAPTVYNPDQTDSDHNGIGDVIEGVVLEFEDRILLDCAEESKLTARLLKRGRGIADQMILFYYDADGDEIQETYTGITNEKGIASAIVVSMRPRGHVDVSATWDGWLVSATDTTTAIVVNRSPGPPLCPNPVK